MRAFLKGVVTKVDKQGSGHLEYEVLAENGVTCYLSDIYGQDRTFPVGAHLCMEEAKVMFDNGRLSYLMPEDSDDVFVGEAAKGYYVPAPVPKGFETDLAHINAG